MAEQLFNQPGSHLNRQEYMALRDGTFKLGDNPSVVYDLLEMSRQRALGLLDQHNANVEATAKSYGKYGGAEAKDLYTIPRIKTMETSGVDPTKIPGAIGSQKAPVIIGNPNEELPKLAPGTYWQTKDGKMHGTIPGAAP